jgi:hypothetical protein
LEQCPLLQREFFLPLPLAFLPSILNYSWNQTLRFLQDDDSEVGAKRTAAWTRLPTH